MTRIVAVANQKGGVGKTTTAINLAASLAAARRRVLLVDLDPQGNATTGCGVDKRTVRQSSYDVLVGDVPAERARLRLAAAEFDLLPGNGDLTAADMALFQVEGREGRLRAALAPVRDDYDYVLIDCPPALNMLTVNALAAAQGVLVPMQCEYYALEGLSALLDSVERIRRQVNGDLEIEGILRTMYDSRNRLASDVSAQLLRFFDDRVYRTVIPRNVRLAEAPSHGVPALLYDKSSRGAVAYLALAGEVLRRREAAGRGKPVSA